MTDYCLFTVSDGGWSGKTALLTLLCLLSACSDSNPKLFEAVAKDDVALVEQLLKAGANANTKQKGATCLQIAKSAQTTKLLLTFGARPDDRTARGATALHIAAYHRDADQIRELLTHGASVDPKFEGGQTPLHWATIDVMDSQFLPEVVWAVRGVRNGSNLDAMEALLKGGADPNALATWGTPLHNVADRQEVDQVKQGELLLRYGADINARDTGQQTVLGRAMDLNLNKEIIAWLTQNGGTR